MTRGTPVHFPPRSHALPVLGLQQHMGARGVQGQPEAARGAPEGFSHPLTLANEQIKSNHPDPIARSYVEHSTAERVDTDIVITNKIRDAYPDLALTIVPAGLTDLLAYASAGHAEAIEQQDHDSSLGLSHSWRHYIPPAKRIDGSRGSIAARLIFGKFIYRWTPSEGRKPHEFVVYIVDGRDGTSYMPQITNHYILSAPGTQHVVDELILNSGFWLQALRAEIWVFDQGYWQKSAELWNSVKNASWSDVILDEEMKAGIRADVEGFFDSRETYRSLKVPWKRGIIFYGPPGNGKTISIKAMMHTLYGRKDSVPTLYVRSLKSAYGGEYSISSIFTKARQQAPCYLVFEDLDSLVTDQLRSYFLNEVDGLKSNDGILMLGSTNHLDRLDPGIAKRPSRFDRKYLFPNPNKAQREAYCRFWQKKLQDNKEIEFPDLLHSAIAGITRGFSFAYMQEAFVASLLAIARQQKPHTADALNEDSDPLDKYILWREMKKQVQALREGIEEEQEPRKNSDLV